MTGPKGGIDQQGSIRESQELVLSWCAYNEQGYQAMSTERLACMVFCNSPSKSCETMNAQML